MTAPVIASLADVKAFMRYPAGVTSDDTLIQTFIDAAGGVLAYHCNDVLPTRHVETHSGGDCSIWLRHEPIISVSTVRENVGSITFELDFQPVTAPVIEGSSGSIGGGTASSVFAYSIDDYEAGMITRRSVANSVQPFAAGYRNIEVDYVSGREVVPPVLVMALKMLVSHWWRNEELRSVASNASYTQYDAATQSFQFSRETSTTSMYFAVPNSIISLSKASIVILSSLR